MAHFHYVEVPESLDRLAERSEAVVVASPLGDETVLATFTDGVRIMGQRFVIASTVKGTLSSGSEITLLRTALLRPAAGGAPLDRGEAPFNQTEYVLGIRRSTTYPAWLTLGGPSGRIGFDERGTALVEERENAVQEAMAGKTVADVVEIFQASLSPGGS